MGRSIAKHSNSRKNFYISWMDEMGVNPTDSDQVPWTWGDFKRTIKRDLRGISDTFDTPYEETWPEDEIMLLMENGHSKVVVSEYMGLACVGIVSQPKRKIDGWGNVVGKEPDHLAIHYCDDILEPQLQSRLSKRFDLYKAGPYASNGTQMFSRV